MKNLLYIFLLFLLVTFTFSFDNYKLDRKCPEGSERGCAAWGRKTICTCTKKCKEDEYNQCYLGGIRRVICNCDKRYRTENESK